MPNGSATKCQNYRFLAGLLQYSEKVNLSPIHRNSVILICFRTWRRLRNENTWGAFHLVKISGISGSAVNGTRFVGSSHWKISRKSGKSKKVVPFSRVYVSRSLYQFQVHGRAPPRTGVYDQMEQLFTNRKFHFCYHRNFRVFFLNGKRPWLFKKSRVS